MPVLVLLGVVIIAFIETGFIGGIFTVLLVIVFCILAGNAL